MTAPGQGQEKSLAPRRRYRPSITTALVLGFGALIVAGMILVQGISLWSAQKNTLSLLAGNARLAVLSLTRETRRHLQPVAELNRYIAQMIDTGQIDLSNRDELEEVLLTAMAGTPQVFGMAFAFEESVGEVVRVRRGRGALPNVMLSDADEIRRGLEAARNRPSRRQFWGPPVWVDSVKATLVTVQAPMWEGDRFHGVLISTVNAGELSRFIAKSGSGPLTGNRFILYGRDHVLAHRNMADGRFTRDGDIPLPKINEVGDRVLASLWNRENRYRLVIDVGTDIRGHAMEIDDETHIFLYRELAGFGSVPMNVGIYAGPEDGIGVELNRLIHAAVAGIGVIVVSVIGAVWFGRRFSAPIKALAAGSSAVADLEFDDVARLRPSRLRELNEAADAFNRMTTGLRWFETYVPRQLVRRLIERNEPVESEEKRVTVMFTDIAGFSTLSEHMPAAETAALLNDHFAILASCIEDEHGTVDKYIGDSVMAFWEVDDTGSDADRALRAARAIRDRIITDNTRRRAADLPSIRVRIGIHTGVAIVGNIGAPGRVNYTIVGDTVNVAARLEQLAKELGDGDAAVLVSGDTAAHARDRGDLVSQGRQSVRGRAGEIEIYRLDGEPAA